MRNSKGITLVECLVTIAILGILASASLPWFSLAGNTIKLLQQAIERANVAHAQLTAVGELSVLDWAPTTQDSAGMPLICFQKQLVFICEPSKPCLFDGTNWTRDGKVCNDGVLLRKTGG